MSTQKNIDRICIIVLVFCVIIASVFINGKALGIESVPNTMGYETKIFDTSKVHTIDIEMEDWEDFIETCQSEEYSVCNVTIDGEKISNVGIRGKGNTSLSNVSSMESDRYSFKIEFDQYDSTTNYYGLDKLVLNNIIQDTTFMKDYLTYQMMNAFGVSAPLCSYAYITVNGEEWGLYLAVEAVEESFLLRNYGNGYGELYKPDSMDMGGGRGNGKDFNMDDFSENFESGEPEISQSKNSENSEQIPQMPPDGMTNNFGNMEPPDNNGNFSGEKPSGFGGEMPSEFGENIPGMQEESGGERPQMPEHFLGETPEDSSGANPPTQQNGGNKGGGMGSEDVKLQYIDDNPESYSNIFDNAKTSITSADKTRLIESLETLSTGENIESVLDVESVLKYFVVHNYVVNGDSYTGSMVHNYYLYEEDGKLSMIPWDYNLAFGTFMGGNANSSVNDSIDSPLSVSGNGERPMADWIFQSEVYTEAYHQYFSEFLETVDINSIIENAEKLIVPYVEKDPTKFFTYEEFEKGVETLKEFCSLRTESVEKQLSGEEGSVDASHITLSDMGTMNMGGERGEFGEENFDRNSGGRGEIPGKAQDNPTENNIPSFNNKTETAPPEFDNRTEDFIPEIAQKESLKDNAENIFVFILCAITLPIAIVFMVKYKRR